MFRNKYKYDFLNKVIIKRTNRKKTISLSVKDEKIILLSPKLISENFLYDILIKKKNWIIKKLKVQEGLSENKNKKFTDNSSLQKFGKKKSLKFMKSVSEKIVEKTDCIEVYSASKNDIEIKLQKWLRGELELYIYNRLAYYKKLINVKYNSVHIKFYKRKLGSCSYNGKLAFNLKIITMPKKVIDYIIVHELCHLKHFNHSRDFWCLVENYCRDFKDQKKWIKKNQNDIL